MRGKQFFLKCVFFAEQLCRGRLQEHLQAAAASRSQVKMVAAPFIRWFKVKGRCTGAHQPLILLSHLHIFHIPPVPYFNVLMFLLRFHVCVRTLPFGQTVAKNPQYFLQMIWDMAAYANHLIRLSNKGNSFFFLPLHMHSTKERKKITESARWLTSAFSCIRPRRFCRSGPGHQGSERRHAVRSGGAAALPLHPARAVAASTSLQGPAASPAQKCVCPGSRKYPLAEWHWYVQITIRVNE